MMTIAHCFTIISFSVPLHSTCNISIPMCFVKYHCSSTISTQQALSNNNNMYSTGAKQPTTISTQQVLNNNNNMYSTGAKQPTTICTQQVLNNNNNMYSTGAVLNNTRRGRSRAWAIRGTGSSNI